MRAGGGGGTGDAICRDGSPAPSLSRTYRDLPIGDLPTVIYPTVIYRPLRPSFSPNTSPREARPPVLDVDREHHRLHLVVLLVEVPGVLDAPGPAEVAHVHEAIDALLHADEDAEVGDVAHLAADDRSDRVLLLEQRPGIRLDLFHPQRDALCFRVHVQHDGVHLIARRHDLGRVLDPLGPAHLADVHEPLDAGLHLDESAVVGEGDHLAGDARARRILLCGMRPGVFLDLLQTEADAL